MTVWYWSRPDEAPRSIEAGDVMGWVAPPSVDADLPNEPHDEPAEWFTCIVTRENRYNSSRPGRVEVGHYYEVGTEGIVQSRPIFEEGAVTVGSLPIDVMSDLADAGYEISGQTDNEPLG